MIQQKEPLEQVIKRITQMELYFDRIQKAIITDPDSVRKDGSIREMLETLIQYYDDGQWLRDYARDENGELPEGLKRGVLSEDGLYNLLYAIDKHPISDL